MHPLARLDQQYVWHPFTQMRDWLRTEPRVIVSGKGAVIRDARGREYLDANSSIWTNLHGHNHPRLNAALQRQLRRIAHSSALGLANEPASLLAAELVRLANTGGRFTATGSSGQMPRRLGKVFFSDDGSTAMEVALKLAYEYARRTGRSKRPKFLSLESAYHGDTVGAVSLGHIDLFHSRFSGLLFKSDKAMAPYCYRCPYNRARPERADARDYRKCNWECLGAVDARFRKARQRGRPYTGFVFEPLIQGAAGMIPQPPGWLSQATEIARGYEALLVADEVMTGFGRTGLAVSEKDSNRSARTQSLGAQPRPLLFACQKEGVQPDLMAVAKGLSGGYLPIAATLTTQDVFDAFLGDYSEFKTFFHGHSFTGNQLGAAVALENLKLLRSPGCGRAAARLQKTLGDELQQLWPHPQVGDIRQVGLIAGVELVRDWRTREPFELRERAGIRVCEVMAQRGVLTRPIGNVVVLMPPYCSTNEQVRQMVSALRDGIRSLRR